MSIAVKLDDASHVTGVASSVLEQFDRFQREKTKARAKAQADYDQKQLEDAGKAFRRPRRTSQSTWTPTPEVRPPTTPRQGR